MARATSSSIASPSTAPTPREAKGRNRRSLSVTSGRCSAGIPASTKGFHTDRSKSSTNPRAISPVCAFSASNSMRVRSSGILQREAVGGSRWLELAAYYALLLVALLWIGSMAWGLRRLDRDAVAAPLYAVAARAA